MRELEMDRNGEQILTYEVYVECHGKRIACLGTGSHAVDKFIGIVEEGIPNAIEVRYLWENNVLVTLKGETLISLLERHYPEQESTINATMPAEEYLIDCYDMS